MPRSSPTKIKIRQRRQRVLQLRRAGTSFRAIAETIGIEFEQPNYGPGAAFKDYENAIVEIAHLTSKDARAVRTLELERYDNYLLALAAKIQQGDPKSIQTAIQISDRRCKLLGLDAAIHVRIQEGIETGLELELEQFLSALQGRLEPSVFQQVLAAIADLGT